ncbi:hypothetical protein CYMTET_5159 [Cymbomonas tetramitiformis]|uniref:Uncharacterized protein n=1 Tax=Cymbomonas tetramitiformis TaxID=36881 RepID=A0AAE0GZZ4_9CHLO|nr:hypothetical protein CYMTET_5159 [Cymbomonas tetramitiformis]
MPPLRRQAYPGCSWKVIPSNAVQLGPNVRRGPHLYVDTFLDAPVYNLTESTVEYAARRRSKHVNENVDSAADLLGLSCSLIFEGGCAMSGPNVVVVQSPVTEEKAEIGFVEIGDLRSYTDRTMGLVCTGIMPVLLKEDHENLPMAHGGVLRMGYVLRTNSSQFQGLVFLQKDAGDEGWDFRSRSSQGPQIALTEADLENKERRSLMAFQHAFFQRNIIFGE